jgi:integrase
LKRITGLYLRKGKRKDTWILDFLHEGIRHKVRIGSHLSESAAAEIAMVKKTAILKGEAGIGGKKRKDISFEDARKLFEEWAAANKRPGTAKFYGYCLAALSRSFKGKKLSEIVPFTIEAHKKMRKDEDCRVQCNNEMATLSVIFNRCIAWGKYEGTNPATKSKVKRFDIGLTKTRWLTEEEEARLLAGCDEPLRSIVLIGIYSGLRVKSEVLTLKPEHIDLPHRTLTIEGAYAKNKKTRHLPMHSKLVEVFEVLLSQVKGEFLFTNPDGTRLKNIRRSFGSACERAGIKKATPHTLRHTFASRLVMAGVGSLSLQALGRWREPKMVERYVHLTPEHLAKEVEKIGGKVTPLFTPREKEAVSKTS